MEEQEELPLVSIITLAYNHENYIRDCLEGILKQKTSFKFELIIHDDASTDNTANIIKEYEKKYPNVIKPIYQKENQYSKGIAIGRTFLYPCVKGKYIAFCEGDDYWIDPLKLQKQVAFLEANKSYSMVHSDFYIYSQDKKEMNEYHVLDSSQALPENVLSFYRIQTTTVMARTDILLQVIDSDDVLFKKKEFLMGDVPLFFLLSLHGPIGVVNAMTAVYRIISNSTSHKKRIKEKRRFALSSMELRMYLAKKYHLSNDFCIMVSRSYNKRLLAYLLCDIAYAPMFPFENWGVLGRILNCCKKNRSNELM